MLQEDDIILYLFLGICEVLGEKDRKHSQGKLYLSEIVLCGVLFALRGVSFRRFHHWLVKRTLFDTPERSRLLRLVIHYRVLCNEFLGSSTLFTVLDSFGVEMLHPCRGYRSKLIKKLYDKGKSNHRWIIGRKVAVSMNGKLEIIQVSDETANVYDATFNQDHSFADSISLTDRGFKKKEGTPETFKICKRGSWNERMVVETLFSLWTRICNMKRSFHRTLKGFQTKVGYLVALTNLIVNKNETLGFNKLSFVQWSL